MDKDILNKFKESLENELVSVEAELKTIGQINPNNPKDWEAVPDKMDIMTADSNEVADSIESYEENTAVLKQLEIRLNEIKAVLDKMNKGVYGNCEICGEPIDLKRLEANPAASTCVKHMR